MAIREIKLLEDLSAQTPWDQGFFRLRRLLLQNFYLDGTKSQKYRCDVLERAGVDAVALFLYRRDEHNEIKLLFRECIRPAVYFRRTRKDAIQDGKTYNVLFETVAGVLEPKDQGEIGIKTRACLEAEEEAGVLLTPQEVHLLGHGSFTLPGVSAEKIFFAAAEFSPEKRKVPKTDGSPFEEQGAIIEVSLSKAFEQIETGVFCDMKTELGLRRLNGFLQKLS